MRHADAVTGVRRSHRPTRRRTGRRLRAEVAVETTRGLVGITDGVHRDAFAYAHRLDMLGVRVPARGKWRLVVETCERGPLTGQYRHGIMRVEGDDGTPSVLFCWLPRAFSGRRVCLSVVKPSKRRASAKAPRGAKSPRRQQP